ncbi:MAG: iron-containing alcohol dehydrogenase, partial [Phenylobacterium sp.]
DGVALSAIQIAADNVVEVVTNGGNLEARSQMLLASSMAAIAFNVSGLGSTHGTGHAISARLNAAHGQTLATMLPHVMHHNMPASSVKYGQVASRLQAFGGGPGSGESAIEAVIQLRAALGIDRSIRDLGGVERSLIDTLVEDAMADPVNRSNPVPVQRADFEAMYRAAW